MKGARISFLVLVFAIIVASVYSVSAQSLQSQAPMPVSNVKFAIYDGGIYPHEVHVIRSAVNITIENYSASISGIAIDRVEGNSRSKAGTVGKNERSWRAKSTIVLEPGQYEVYSLENPTARALIIVKARP